jgi:hypothetical protein
MTIVDYPNRVDWGEKVSIFQNQDNPELDAGDEVRTAGCLLV